MGLRVGVDVGGTFTKAVAIEARTGDVVARSVVATTHDHVDGVSAGVVAVIAELAARVGADSIELVTHSTTQAVSAMLEGDTAPVGVLGLGRAPDVRKARKRTALKSAAAHEFLDVTGGLDPVRVRAALTRLADAGARAVCVAEAFAPDDSANEQAVAQLASEVGMPVTTSAELSGLYGLELRTVTAALNASMLPIALHTARVVEAGVVAAGVVSPVMVMRGDGGATDLAGFRAGPARTLYSGPAASVAGALRTLRIGDGVIVEVGGTSSNLAAIRGGRPALSHVRVAGVAGGSMLRMRRNRVYGVGPRSAHIAGLPYACFLTADRFTGAKLETVAPRPGDPPDYVALRLADGTRAALTNTCAANALGHVHADDYAAGDRDAALVAFAVAGAVLRLPAEEVARRMLQCTVEALADLVTAVAAQHKLTDPTVVAVGGGAALGRVLADALGMPCLIPSGAEVISSIGDALSLVRCERERTVSKPTAADMDALVAEVEAEALAAGAAPGSLTVEVSQVSDRGALRAVAIGALALSSGVVPGRPELDGTQISSIAERELAGGAVQPVGHYWLGVNTAGGRVLLFDRFGDVVLNVRGEALHVTGPTNGELTSRPAPVLARHARHVGPVTVPPTAWMVQGGRVREMTDHDSIAPAVDTGQAVVIIGRD